MIKFVPNQKSLLKNVPFGTLVKCRFHNASFLRIYLHAQSPSKSTDTSVLVDIITGDSAYVGGLTEVEVIGKFEVDQ